MWFRILCLVVASVISAASQDIDGQWAVTMPFGSGTAELILELHVDGEELTGSISGPYAKLTISGGRVSADGFSFETTQAGNGGTTIRVRYTCELAGDELRLTASADGAPGESLVLHRRDLDAPVKNPFVERPAPREVVEWLTERAVPLQTVEAGHGFDDLEPLKNRLSTARVVAVGEATHGTREFFQMKHRMLEFLVSEMGFTVFAIEANWPEALAVNDYVLNGNGDAVKVLAGLRFWTWYTEETLAMIEWMREWNLTHDRKVKFHGFDMQFPFVAVEKALSYLASVDHDYAESLKPRLADLAVPAGMREYPSASAETKDRVSAAVAELGRRLDEHREEYAAATSEADWQTARQHARIVAQAEEKLRLPPDEGRVARDRYMAENVRWILDHEPPGTRMMLWAHNGHVAASKNHGQEPMGFYLRRALGDQLAVIGFSFGEGSFQARDSLGPLREFTLGPPPEGSLDATLSRTGLPLFVIDLREDPSSDAVRTWLDVPHVSRQIGASFSDSVTWHNAPTLARAQFDLLIFVARTTRARPVPR